MFPVAGRCVPAVNAIRDRLKLLPVLEIKDEDEHLRMG
jgi:hypothetical protein